MKKKRTKYQMFFTPIGMLESMTIGWDKHYAKYGIYPKRIYLPKEKYLIYQRDFDRLGTGKVYFRGAEVLSQT